MFGIFLIATLLTVAKGNLFIGLHYTSAQRGDVTLEIGVNTDLTKKAGWNNNLSRYKITGAETWEFYDNNYFGGQPLFVKTGPLDWTWVNKAFNDRVSSVKMSGRLYIGKHYSSTQGGDKVVKINEPQNLDSNSLDNNFSRFKIPGPDTWEFYSNPDFEGKPLFTKTGPLDWTRVDNMPGGSAAFNDIISSVKLAGPLLSVLSEYQEPFYTGVKSYDLKAGGKIQAVKGDWTCTAK